MRKITFFLFIFFISFAWAQQKYTLSGIISDAATGEKLLGVNYTIKNANTGTTTNEYGFYSITLPEGKYEVVIEYLGYQTIY